MTTTDPMNGTNRDTVPEWSWPIDDPPEGREGETPPHMRVSPMDELTGGDCVPDDHPANDADQRQE